MHIAGGGKLPELGNGHVLHSIAVQRGMVGRSQHELEVVHYHVLDVIYVHSMSHCLGGVSGYRTNTCAGIYL